MKPQLSVLVFLILVLQACSGVPKKYTEVCEGDGCKHMVSRCKQMKAAESRQTQYGVTPINEYRGPALVDGMWSVRCRNGKVVEIMDSKFKDIKTYEGE